MASTKNVSNQADDIRYQSYLTQMERQHQADVQDKKEEHKDKLGRIIETQESQQSQIRKDYDVRISDEAESLDRKLNLIRERNQILVEQERERGEREADKMRTMYQTKIENEKKVGDAQLARQQEYYRKASEEISRQAQKDQAQRTNRKGNA